MKWAIKSSVWIFIKIKTIYDGNKGEIILKDTSNSKTIFLGISIKRLTLFSQFQNMKYVKLKQLSSSDYMNL